METFHRLLESVFESYVEPQCKFSTIQTYWSCYKYERGVQKHEVAVDNNLVWKCGDPKVIKFFSVYERDTLSIFVFCMSRIVGTEKIIALDRSDMLKAHYPCHKEYLPFSFSQI